MKNNFDLKKFLTENKLTRLSEQDEEWDVDVSDKWNVKDLTVGDKLTPEMFQDSATPYTGIMNDATIIRYDNDGIKDSVAIEFINSIGMKTRNLFYVDVLNEKVLKPQYKIVPPLNEQDEDWDVDVSNNWNIQDLGIGDEITLDMINENDETIYDYFLYNFGPRTFPILIGKSSAGEEYVTLKPINSKSEKVRQFSVNWLNEKVLKPQYQVVPSLDEYDTWNYI